MSWGSIAEATIDILSMVLIVRLLRWRLHNVYRIFCVFLIFDLLSSAATFAEESIHSARFDYRITWICFNVVGWILSLCIVYGLLQAMLAGLPGIRSFSRKLLSITFVSVVIISLLTIRLDVAVSGSTGYLARTVDKVGKLVRIAFDLDRVISTVALLVLLVIVAFVLWFPVQMPRNLAVFTIGFVVYFAANTGLLLTRGLWSRQSIELVSNVTLSIITACYAYWTIFLTRRAKLKPSGRGTAGSRTSKSG